ncbi:MAG: protein kinase [Planctomycetes bacterium]|nr:protein kinase [Planctomycetota bacterium]
MSQDAEKTQIDPSGGPQPGVKMKLGPYETTEILGRGGMAVVYKGMQQSLGRIVAIKVLPKEFSRDRQFVGRFHREAESVAKLNHPNIIQIIDKGEDGGTCYFVMEYVKGMSLGARLANKGVTFKELLEIGLQVCSALHYAHEQGVVHRDIKPANILLDDTTGIAKVADFGIAQLAEKSTAIGTLTGDHMAMGTLDYMAPEQKRDAKNVDRRADVYSLGVMLYEMSTGRVPMGIFDPPSRINRELPKDFDVIVMKCLRDKPDDRFQSCMELSSAMASLPQSPSTMVRVMTSVKSGVTNIGTQIGRRNPRYIAALLFLVAGLGIGSFAIWKWGRGRGSGGEVAGGGGSGTNGGGTGTKPADDTAAAAVAAAAAAEKAYKEQMDAAAGKVASHDYQGALEIYEQLTKTAGAKHQADIDQAVANLRADQANGLATKFLGRLQNLIVPPAESNADYLAKLTSLLEEANAAKMPARVTDSISGAIAQAKKDIDKNEAAASDARRKQAFAESTAKIQKLLDGDDLDAAATEIASLSKDHVLPLEIDELDRLTSLLNTKRAEKASADDNRKTYEGALVAAADALKLNNFHKARYELKTAAAAGGPEKAATVKDLQDKVDARECEYMFALQLDEAQKLEVSNPSRAAQMYREAAKKPPTPEEGKAAIAKAEKLEAGIRDAETLKEYSVHMDAAKNAMAAHDWKLAMDEATLALAQRRDDPEAAKLLGDAREAFNTKPPDPPKLLVYKYKGIVKGKFGSIKSISVAPSGVLYAIDEKPQKAYAIGTDLQILRECKLPYEYPDRVFVDSKGTVWTSEWGNLSTINRLNPETLAVEQTVGGYGPEEGKFTWLVDIALSPDGDSIYGLESKVGYRLERVSSRDGKFLGKSGGLFKGKGPPTPGMFIAPKNLAIDKQGRVYVSDSSLKNIQRFKPDTSFDSVFLSTPDVVPGAMAWGGDRLFVVNTNQFKIDIYSPDAKYLGSFGERGAGESQFAGTTGISVSAGGKVYVIDRATRITVWEEEK